MDTETTTLYTATNANITLRNALSALPAQKAEGLIGLLYTPRWCGLVRWADGRAETPNESVDLDQVYEARFFNNTLELRWLRDPESNGVGQAACLSEESITPNGWTRGSRDELKPLPGQYLLSGWGCKADDLPQGWSLLSNASVGKRTIPLAGVGANMYAVLRYREYLGPPEGEAGEKHGNNAIYDERLLGLDLAKEKQK
jgi:CRISPR-associated protein (TIGR03984 family)